MPAEPEQCIADLLDREAIRNLIASYGPLADRGDAIGVASLWEEDGIYDVGGFGEARGRTAIAALIESETHHALMRAGCAHILSPHCIELDEDEATATGYSIVYRREAEGFAPWRVSENSWRLVRQPDGRWLVRLRINRPIEGLGTLDPNILRS